MIRSGNGGHGWSQDLVGGGGATGVGGNGFSALQVGAGGSGVTMSITSISNALGGVAGEGSWTTNSWEGLVSTVDGYQLSAQEQYNYDR